MGVQAMDYQLDKKAIKALSQGRWFDIYYALASQYQAVWNKAMIKRGNTYASSPCPVCGGVDRFGFMKDGELTGAAYCRSCGAFPDGFELLQKINNATFYQVLKQVNDYVTNGSNNPPRYSPPTLPKQPEINTKGKTKAIETILKQCSNTPDLPHKTYLASRGLDAPINNPSILYHKGVPYYHEGKVITKDNKWITYPAIIARISNSSGWLGLHQTYLTKDGTKATSQLIHNLKEQGYQHAEKVSCKKFLLKGNELLGGAVRLGKAGKVLAICEGIETALALQKLSGGFSAIAAALTCNNLKNIEIPEPVEKIVIFADKDRNHAGEQAAYALFERERHVRECEILLPDMPIPDQYKGIDWLDVLTFEGSVLNQNAKIVQSALYK